MEFLTFFLFVFACLTPAPGVSAMKQYFHRTSQLQIMFYRFDNLHPSWCLFCQYSRKDVNNESWGTVVAQWIRLRLPSCCPGFESQAHQLRFYQFKFEFTL